MRHQPLTPAINHTFLRHEVDLGGDGPAGLQRSFDPGFEVSGHGGGVLDEDLEDVVVGQIQVFFRVEAERVDYGGGEEFNLEGRVGDNYELQRREGVG